MVDSIFDPETFLNTQITEPTATEYVPVPENTYEATVDTVDLKTGDGWTRLDVVWNLLGDDIKIKMNRDKVTVRQNIFLDIENGVLAGGEGKNVQLGRLRAALAANEAGMPVSLKDLEGRGPALVKVSHETYLGTPQARVTNVAKAS